MMRKMDVVRIFGFLLFIINQGLMGDEALYSRNWQVRRSADTIDLLVTRINPSFDDTLCYRILRREKKIVLPDGRWVVYPLTDIGISTALHAGAFYILDAMKQVKMMANQQYVEFPPIKEALRQNQLIEVGSDMGLNLELLMLHRPSLFFVNQVGSPFDLDDPLNRLGIPYVVSAEWMESDILGRSEWIRFFAYFIGAEERANEIMAQWQFKVDPTRARINASLPVLWCSFWPGQIWLAGGHSYVADAIQRCGYSFSWQNSTSISQQVGMEYFFTMLPQTRLIVCTGTFLTMQEINDIEPRLALSADWRKIKVWSLKPAYHETSFIYPRDWLEELSSLGSGGSAEPRFFQSLKRMER